MKNDATLAQIAAARPDASTWVSANAGSGKTRVLTNRVARLLLAGTEPQKILCLTYTKAAAAVMQNRLFEQLGEWAMKPDAALRAALDDLGESGLDDEKLAKARTLFARALETPGGLKIQTIHSLCDSILRQFPLEAGVAPGFDLMEERQAKQLRGQVMEQLAQDPAQGFGAVAAYLSGDMDGLDSLLQDILKHRKAFAAEFDRAAVAAALGISGDNDDTTILAQAMQGFSDQQLTEFAAALAIGGAHDQATSAALQSARNQPASAALELLFSVFLTAKGELRKTTTFPTKAVKTKFPWTEDLTITLMERIFAAKSEQAAVRVLAKTEALHRFATKFLSRYRQAKSAIGRLDFDDQIQIARGLLTQSDMAQWVLFRLDGGIDHILVDEAQDTSPDQWEIVRALASEFTAGKGQSDADRTIFVVGDEKQSIYSFQGADPQAFDAMRNLFGERLRDSGAELQKTGLLYSFRSARPILEFVDRVFQGDAAVGVAMDIQHRPFHSDQPGRVDLWPMIEPSGEADSKPWFEPVDAPEPGAPKIRLAKAIAAEIRRMLKSGTMLPTRKGPRPVRAGDILILVQGRQEIFHSIIKELKALQVPVAGADRENITDSLAVQDLLALLQFMATPEDDLSLAAVLRSPLFGITESELFGLAHGRERTLWSALQSHEARFPDAVKMLKDLLSRDEFLRPFEILDRVLTVHKGRRRILARLGPEAEEAVDELLSQALSYESVEAPSLTGFLDWLTSDKVEVKRQMEDTLDQVRVMTVHGAKGLEAPIVILPDTIKLPGGRTADVVLHDDLPFWATGGRGARALGASIDAAKNKAAEERKRLLYVAMTRAESWLIICGAQGKQTVTNTWYDMAAAGFAEADAEPLPAPEGIDGEGLSIRYNWDDGAGEGGVAKASQQKLPLPECLSEPAPAPPAKLRIIQPSDLGGAHALFDGDAIEEEQALRRGRQIHLLLEVLPDVPHGERETVAKRLLGSGEDAAGDAFPALFSEACSVLDAPDLRKFFAPDALKEAGISAILQEIDGARIVGRVDCMLVREDHVLIVDFKSNRVVPDSPEQTPEGILRQMGAYRAALALQFPTKEIRCAILWTYSAQLMPLPQHIVAEALMRTEFA